MSFLLILPFLIFCTFPVYNSLHLTGEWKPTDFFLFLGKFGFQQTDANDIKNSQGYIYGNITSQLNSTSNYALVVVDSELFLEYFIHRHDTPYSLACTKMFENIDKIAWDSQCNSNAKQDYLRYIPCKKDGLCDEENIAQWVISKSQFTYRVEDVKSPRFWYLSMVACTRNHNLKFFNNKNVTLNAPSSHCKWTYNPNEDDIITYDIWVVNGEPSASQQSLFSHQFSFEMHSIFEVYIVFFFLYLILLPLQIYATSVQRHQLPALLLTCILLEFLGITFNLIHTIKFAYDGRGIEKLKIIGDFIDTMSQCFFMLLLLIIVMGWVLCYKKMSRFSWIILLTIWLSYTSATIVLFSWNQAEIDFVSEIDEWRTTPGHIILIFRIIIMFFFLYELRNTFLNCTHPSIQMIYLHFGAGYLVWFVYLPLAIMISSWVSIFWRYKTMISIIYSADFISLCIMVHLLWTSHSYLFYNHQHLQKQQLDLDGLNEFASSRTVLTNINFNLLSKKG